MAVAAKPIQWTCAVCGRHATLGQADRAFGTLNLSTGTSREAGEGFQASAYYDRCPNVDCSAPHVRVVVYHAKAEMTVHGIDVTPNYERPAGIGRFQFLPSTSHPLSRGVPSSVLQDYQEAYLIRSLSPKASATLARRALQGMIRDFWAVSRPTLHAELQAIKDRCDPDVYDAMMAMKSIGNIGAHPERDIALMIDIEQGEAQQLLDLIHLLDQEWYVARATKQSRVERLKALAAAKAAEQGLSGLTAIAAPAIPAVTAPSVPSG